MTPEQLLYRAGIRLGFFERDIFADCYGCPVCGRESDGDIPEDGSLKEVLKFRENPYYAREFGSTGYDWLERHECPDCGECYEVSNSSH